MDQLWVGHHLGQPGGGRGDLGTEAEMYCLFNRSIYPQYEDAKRGAPMPKRRTKASALPLACPIVLAGLGVNNRCDKGTWATHSLDSYHRLRATLSLLSLPSCGLILGNEMCWLDTNRVGQSTSTPLYLWFTVGGGGVGFGTMVRRQAFLKVAFKV